MELAVTDGFLFPPLQVTSFTNSGTFSIVYLCIWPGKENPIKQTNCPKNVKYVWRRRCTSLQQFLHFWPLHSLWGFVIHILFREQRQYGMVFHCSRDFSLFTLTDCRFVQLQPFLVEWRGSWLSSSFLSSYFLLSFSWSFIVKFAPSIYSTVVASQPGPKAAFCCHLVSWLGSGSVWHKHKSFKPGIHPENPLTVIWFIHVALSRVVKSCGFLLLAMTHV